jgi:hypothetical protein
MNKHDLLRNVVMGAIFMGTSNVYGLVKSDIDDTHKLKVTFSMKDTNRITIDNSRIAQVFGVEELMAIQFDEENGQCFVKAKTNPGHPVTLTLITEEGETQDLELTFADVPSELVRLHSLKKDLTPLSEVMDEVGEAPHQQAIELIKQLVRKQIPKGFTVMELIDSKDRVLENGGTLRYTQHLSGSGWNVMIGTLTNSTDRRMRVKESLIAGESDVAVYLSQCELHTGQSATCVIVRKRG